MKRVIFATLSLLFFQQSIIAQVEVVYEFPDNYVYEILNANGDFAYFKKLNLDTKAMELWITDGSEAGTKAVVTDLYVDSRGDYDVGLYENRFYFFASTPNTYGSEKKVSVYAYDELTGTVELIKQGNDDSNTRFMYIEKTGVANSINDNQSIIDFSSSLFIIKDNNDWVQFSSTERVKSGMGPKPVTDLNPNVVFQINAQTYQVRAADMDILTDRFFQYFVYPNLEDPLSGEKKSAFYLWNYFEEH